MLKLILLTVLFCLIHFCACDEDCSNQDVFCKQESNCQDCIRLHHCCIWCYEKDKKGCYAKGSVDSLCNPLYINDNFPSKVEVKKNLSFSDVEDNVNSAVQFSPSEFAVDLRYDEPVNISFRYRPAKNYPLDLYYLMDLTYSMKPDLEILENLGSELAKKLTKLTKHYQIAFGSFVDIPKMPFYITAPLYMDKPCSLANIPDCEKGYLFKHKLNFTSNVDNFVQQLNSSRLSANLDDPEGGMAALMQVIFCKTQLNWRDNSRKLVLIATGGGMHLAGDGILAGYVKRNLEECLIDTNGNYFSDKQLDYPSLEELYYRLKEKKINLIMAAKSEVLEYYKHMENVLKETIRVEELKNESRKVLRVVEDGYYNFMKQVNLLANLTKVSGLEAKFFSDCNGEGIWGSENCNNAEEGVPMEFMVQLKLTEYPQKQRGKIYIEESNINEKITIRLNFIGSKCNCSNLANANINCVHGTSTCGECACEKGWVGNNCAEECHSNFKECKAAGKENQFVCSGRGDCICSKCVCESPRFQGKFCEFECPVNRWSGKICNDHGTCQNGTCQCEERFTGKNCDCENSTEQCQIPGSKGSMMCNGLGNCECNRCQCFRGYSGQYCEKCQECTGLCNHYEKRVTEFVLTNNTEKVSDNLMTIEIVEKLDEEDSCINRYKTDEGEVCDILFKYRVLPDRRVQIKTTRPKCTKPMAAGLMVGIIIAAILAMGVLAVIIWKGRNMYKDRQEYQAFLKNMEGKRTSGINPLYKDPVVKYRNPILESSSSHSKVN